MRDAIVIGSGLAGLTAALRLAKGGKTVSLISKGPGGLQLSQGTFDILGYSPDRVSDPLDAPARPRWPLDPEAAAANPTHAFGRKGAKA